MLRVLCSIALLLCGVSWAQADAPVCYTVTLDAAGPEPLLSVEITFVGDRSGTTDIDLPSEWAGSKGLEKNISDLTVKGGTLLPVSDPARRTIRHRPGAHLILHYQVHDGAPGAPDAKTFEKAQPVVKTDYLYIHAEGAFAAPSGRETTPARFRWGRKPTDWQLVSDLDLADPATLTVQGMTSAILVGGKALRLTPRRVEGQPLLVAVLGKWSFTDTELADRIATLIATENDMLSASAAPFLVSLLPLSGSQTGHTSFGGSGRTSGYALTSTDNVPIQKITPLLAHEYAHRWFGKGWGPQAENGRDYWFTEGFTDWFASLALVRSGLRTPAEWRSAVDGLLFRYETSPALGLSPGELEAQFWINQDAMQIPYDRGHLSAVLLDRMLRDRGKSLLAVLTEMGRAPLSPAESEVDRLNRLAGKKLVADARGIASSVPLPTTMFGPCDTLESTTQSTYDQGFTLGPNHVVQTVRQESPAWSAGLRPGFRFVRLISATPGDAGQPFAAEFQDGDSLRQLSWLPEGIGRVTFQRLAKGQVATPGCNGVLE